VDEQKELREEIGSCLEKHSANRWKLLYEEKRKKSSLENTGKHPQEFSEPEEYYNYTIDSLMYNVNQTMLFWAKHCNMPLEKAVQLYSGICKKQVDIFKNTYKPAN
jgi:hypothetical protein